MTILPTLRQLQFFAALARRQSFSRAAEDCLVSQSTLSSAIKELEGLLEVQLVDRSTRNFALTPAGETVAAQAAAILAAAHDLVSSVRDTRTLTGPFNLGVIPTIAPFLLPALTPRLTADYPELRLYLREDLTANLLKLLSAGQLDAAILALPYALDGFESMTVGTDPFWFAAAPDHPLLARKDKPVTLADLGTTPLMLLEDGHCLRDHALEACRLHTAESRAGYEATSLFTLAEMTRAGLGATLLPDMAVRAGMARSTGLTVRPLADASAARDIGLVWRKGAGRAGDAEALGRALTDALTTVQAENAA